MPIYSGLGPFPITVQGREFSFSFEEPGSWSGFAIDSADGRLHARTCAESIDVWGEDFPGTSAKLPWTLNWPTLSIRCPENAVQAVIEHCLASRRAQASSGSLRVTQPAVVSELRKLGREGRRPAEMLRAILPLLNESSPHTLTLVIHMREAFHLSLADAKPIAGWWYPGGRPIYRTNN